MDSLATSTLSWRTQHQLFTIQLFSFFCSYAELLQASWNFLQTKHDIWLLSNISQWPGLDQHQKTWPKHATCKPLKAPYDAVILSSISIHLSSAEGKLGCCVNSLSCCFVLGWHSYLRPSKRKLYSHAPAALRHTGHERYVQNQICHFAHDSATCALVNIPDPCGVTAVKLKRTSGLACIHRHKGVFHLLCKASTLTRQSNQNDVSFSLMCSKEQPCAATSWSRMYKLDWKSVTCGKQTFGGRCLTMMHKSTESHCLASLQLIDLVNTQWLTSHPSNQLPQHCHNCFFDSNSSR